MVFLRRVCRLPATANVLSSSPILITLIMKELRSSETSILTRATRRNILENGILQRIFVLLMTFNQNIQDILISLFSKVSNNYNYKVEEDEVGGTCGTNGGEEERV
jgi:hypothetical protein